MEKKQEEAPKTKLNASTFRHLIGIYRFMLPYQKHFILGMLALVLSSGIVLAFPFFTGKLIDVALKKSDWWLNDINSIVLALLLILLVQSGFSFLRVYFFSQVSEKSMADIRTTLYEKLMTLPLTFYDTRRIGELNSRLSADVALLQSTFSITLAEFFRQIFILLFGISILFFTTPRLTFFMLATFPILVLAVLFFGKYIRKLSKQTQDQLAQTNTIVEETLQSVSMVKAFTNEFYEVHRYKEALAESVKTALRAANYRGAFISFVVFAIFGGIVAVLWYGSNLVMQGEISIGELTAFVIYTMFIGGSIGGLGDLYGQIQKAIGSSERILEILAMDSEAELKNTVTDLKLNGKIRYQNIRFAYPTRPEMEVLKNLNLEIKAGEKIALVGQSGAGKTTITQLLLRHYHANEGSIFLDEKQISAYDLQAYRQNIGVVPQEVILFGGTITENIAYGKPNANFEQIREAAQKANALQFIESFPEKFETIVGERGIKLSGGQRQRIAIARAILKNPSILILDEATSSLDAESEFLVQEALKNLMQNRTTIIIAHRLATIREADCIYVLEKGEIVEQGTHEQLLEKSGTYSNLVKLQLNEA